MPTNEIVLVSTSYKQKNPRTNRVSNQQTVRKKKNVRKYSIYESIGLVLTPILLKNEEEQFIHVIDIDEDRRVTKDYILFLFLYIY